MAFAPRTVTEIAPPVESVFIRLVVAILVTILLIIHYDYVYASIDIHKQNNYDINMIDRNFNSISVGDYVSAPDRHLGIGSENIAIVAFVDGSDAAILFSNDGMPMPVFSMARSLMKLDKKDVPLKHKKLLAKALRTFNEIIEETKSA